MLYTSFDCESGPCLESCQRLSRSALSSQHCDVLLLFMYCTVQVNSFDERAGQVLVVESSTRVQPCVSSLF